MRGSHAARQLIDIHPFLLRNFSFASAEIPAGVSDSGTWTPSIAKQHQGSSHALEIEQPPPSVSHRWGTRCTLHRGSMNQHCHEGINDLVANLTILQLCDDLVNKFVGCRHYCPVRDPETLGQNRHRACSCETHQGDTESDRGWMSLASTGFSSLGVESP